MQIQIKLVVILLSLLLAACGTTTSEIIPAGKDTFFISGRGYAVTSSNAFPHLYKKANAFCNEHGKLMNPVSSHSEKVDQMSSSVELTFRCLLESDPEYQRPNMKPVPNASIEVIQK
jgi:predicted small secreted protein